MTGLSSNGEQPINSVPQQHTNQEIQKETKHEQ